MAGGFAGEELADFADAFIFGEQTAEAFGLALAFDFAAVLAFPFGFGDAGKERMS